MNNLHHEHGQSCPLCNWKLREANPDLAAWFYRIKKRYENVHVAWAYRDQATQNKMVADGKSRAPWPKSKHNRTDANGKPSAEALDLFLLDDDGNARWPKLFYSKLAAENKADREQIAWAGDWKDFLEQCHFELRVKT